jgi:hypothetical protein
MAASKFVSSPEEYAEMLASGEVDAIVNGRPFRSKLTDRLLCATERERYVAAMFVRYPERAGDIVPQLPSDHDIVDEQYRAIIAACRRQYREVGTVAPMQLLPELNRMSCFHPDHAAGVLLELGNADDIDYTTAFVPLAVTAIRDAAEKRKQLSALNLWKEAIENGHTSDESLAVIDAELWELKRATLLQPNERRTFADLRAEFPKLRPIVIDGLLRQGETANVVSHTKAGKSWFGYMLLFSVVMGSRFLDKFQAQRGRALLIDNELHPETIAYRIQESANALTIHPDQYESDLEVWSLRGRLRSLADLANELEQIEPGEFDLIVWDSKYRFGNAGGDENSNAHETAVYNLIDQIGGRTNAAQVLIHHTSKGNQSDKRTTDVGSGAGAQSRAVDTHLVLREHADDGLVVLDCALRSFAPVDPLVLRWTFPLWLPDDSADPACLKRPQSAQEQQQAARNVDADNQIIAALCQGEATVRILRDQTGLSRGRIERRLDWLYSEDRVTYSETIKRGNNCRVYRLADIPND